MVYYTKTLDNCVVMQTGSGTGYSSVSDVQTAFNQSRSAGAPLFIKPGLYTTTEILVNSSTGGGGILSVSAAPGSVTLQLTSGNNLFSIDGIYCCLVENLIFDCNYVAFSNQSTASAAISGTQWEWNGYSQLQCDEIRGDGHLH